MIAIAQSELGRALFEESGDALLLLDPETDRLIEVNPVALRLTGFSREEILPLPASYLFRFEAAGGSQRLRAALQKTMVFHSQDGFLLRGKADGAWVPVNLTVSRLHGSRRRSRSSSPATTATAGPRSPRCGASKRNFARCSPVRPPPCGAPSDRPART